MKIKKVKDKLIIEIPLKQKINNPYMDDIDLGFTGNLIGVIAGDDYTISQLIDLSYKGDQQEGMPIIQFTSEEKLKEACKIGGLDIIEHATCSECGKVIYGSCTWGDNGPICYKCEKD